VQNDFKERIKVELNPADTNGYTFTQEEKNIIKQDSKYNSKQSITKLSNDTGKYINPNLIDLPELQLSEKEHEEIAYKTVGKVIEKLDQEVER